MLIASILLSNRPQGNFTIAEQTGLSLTLEELFQDRFSHYGAHSLTPSTKKSFSVWGYFSVVYRFDMSREIVL